TMCRRLDAAGAARVAEAVVVAVRDPKTSAGARTIFASVLGAVGDRLDPVRADSLERALVDSLLTVLADVKSLNYGGVGGARGGGGGRGGGGRGGGCGGARARRARLGWPMPSRRRSVTHNPRSNCSRRW